MWKAEGASLRGSVGDHAVELTPWRSGAISVRITLPPRDGQWQACLALVTVDDGIVIENAKAGTNRGAGFIERPLSADENVLLAAVIADVDATLGWKTIAEAAAVVSAEATVVATQAGVMRAAEAYASAGQALEAAKSAREAAYAEAGSETRVSPVMNMVRSLQIAD